MCLAVPMKIEKIEGKFALVKTGGILKRINIEMLPSISVGDFVLVHTGFAIQKIDKKAAEETFKIIDEIH